MEGVVDLIGTLGFPIFACIFMAIFVWKLIRTNQKNQEEIETKFAEAIEKMSTALVENTKQINRLVNEISKKEL